jgi:hypothetical protein
MKEHEAHSNESVIIGDVLSTSIFQNCHRCPSICLQCYETAKKKLLIVVRVMKDE